jgi:8-oxo-dGTP pyrophosphatase MutT (NUDIX family)
MTKQDPQGVINHTKSSTRRTDYLYRISLKGFIRNDKGEFLTVKERGRDWWDLPGGGMDHNEGIKTALARELKEEINLKGDFTYCIISIDEPTYVDDHDFWQVRLIFEVKPEIMEFSPGEDGDEVIFMNPHKLENSNIKTEQSLLRYYNQLIN